ncbi:MAG: 4-hydroxythreonine-4-phosphate dehydrogenase PdxA, partial [Rhizobacter sp.]|nr:4-hydroxythreonine-4-phosphate dehydrogenase PdxA [Chlorobiales bacterium]
EILTPAIARLQEKFSDAFSVAGPFAADGFFGMKTYKNYDAVLAMYHDQGLIAFKMLAFETGVNFTAGLPIVRTSPDHGTAFDIAGKGTASETSFVEATRLAVKIASARMNGINRIGKIQAEET